MSLAKWPILLHARKSLLGGSKSYYFCSLETQLLGSGQPVRLCSASPPQVQLGAEAWRSSVLPRL